MNTGLPPIPDALRPHPLAAAIDLNGRGHYLHWGFVQVSAANVVIVAVILAVFVAALFLPFPKGRDRR